MISFHIVYFYLESLPLFFCLSLALSHFQLLHCRQVVIAWICMFQLLSLKIFVMCKLLADVSKIWIWFDLNEKWREKDRKNEKERRKSRRNKFNHSAYQRWYWYFSSQSQRYQFCRVNSELNSFCGCFFFHSTFNSVLNMSCNKPNYSKLLNFILGAIGVVDNFIFEQIKIANFSFRYIFGERFSR